MDKTLKAKWIKALRSGKYRQVDSVLYDTQAYCCLGVLCRVAGARWRNRSPHLQNECIANEGGNEELSDNFRERIGLSHNEQKTLINMNDNGNSFKTIADHIEKYL